MAALARYLPACLMVRLARLVYLLRDRHAAVRFVTSLTRDGRA